MKYSSCVRVGIRAAVCAGALAFWSWGQGATVLAEQLHEKEPDLDLTPLIQKAEAGDSEAQAALGIFYVAGREVAQNVPEGIRWLEKAAKSDDARALYYWGLCFLDGIGMNVDHAKGRELIQRSMELGYAPAKMFLGKCILEARYGFEKDLSRAVELLEEAANEENAEAQYLLGTLYSGKEKGIAPSRRRMMKWLTLSASHGFTSAQVSLGREYLLVGNRFWAREWLEEALESNCAEAALLLGLQALDGWGTGTPDLAEAQKMLRRAANGGMAEAQLLLGAMKREMGADFDAAFWIQAAALAGLQEAEEELKKMTFSPEVAFKMGTTLFMGMDGIKSFEKARDWLALAEKGNVPGADFLLAEMELYGIGGEVNLPRAVELMEKGVKNENGELISELAWCVYAGLGTPQDFNRAADLAKKLDASGRADSRVGALYALCAFLGQGMERNRELAQKKFREACAAQDPFAEAWVRFDTTHPIPDDATEPEKVWEIVRKAAEEGIASAQCLLGIAFERGIGVSRDLPESNRWLSMAAEQGFATAEFLMFTHAEWGVGMDPDPIVAEKLLNAARAKGYLPAIHWETMKKRSFLESTTDERPFSEDPLDKSELPN